VVNRGGIHWADLGPPAGRRPVCVLTRDGALGVLQTATCAPITRTVRGIASEVEIGPEHGLPDTGVITCDNIITLPQSAIDPEPVGILGPAERAALDRALRFALDIVY
jgi:mRNA interferase MazF